VGGSRTASSSCADIAAVSALSPLRREAGACPRDSQYQLRVYGSSLRLCIRGAESSAQNSEDGSYTSNLFCLDNSFSTQWAGLVLQLYTGTGTIYRYSCTGRPTPYRYGNRYVPYHGTGTGTGTTTVP
jgi:hypothetical protein